MKYSRILAASARTMSQKINYPSAERNKIYILEILSKHLENKKGNVLEISSGTGQHLYHFAPRFPKLTFQPSEYEKALLDSIKSYADDTPTKNIKPPVIIDVTTDCKTWKVEQQYDYIINVNMIHISPFECTEGLFRNSAKLLRRGGLLITYGPYANNGIIEPQSNIDFDQNLRQRDPSWGLRDIQDLKEVAKQHSLKLLHIYDMPANNKTLIWQKE